MKQRRELEIRRRMAKNLALALREIAAMDRALAGLIRRIGR